MIVSGAGRVRDGDIRGVLRARLEGQAGAGLVLDEFSVVCGSARVDVAMVDTALHGFEIKSDVDDLARLVGQAQVYDRVLDFSWLVVGERHFERASGVVPGHWGLLRASARDGGVCLVPERDAVYNEGVDPRSLAMMLWRVELVEELKARSAYRGLSRHPRGALWDRLVEVTQRQELRDVVRERIKFRSPWPTGAAPF